MSDTHQLSITKDEGGFITSVEIDGLPYVPHYGPDAFDDLLAVCEALAGANPDYAHFGVMDSLQEHARAAIAQAKEVPHA